MNICFPMISLCSESVQVDLSWECLCKVMYGLYKKYQVS